MQWTKIHELHAEIEKIEEDAFKHAYEMEGMKDRHTVELKQVQREHAGEVAELKSRVVQLEQEAKGLKEAEEERQAARQVKAGGQRVLEYKLNQAELQAVSYGNNKATWIVCIHLVLTFTRLLLFCAAPHHWKKQLLQCAKQQGSLLLNIQLSPQY